MVKNIYALKDLKIGFNGGLFDVDSHEVAVRDLKIAVNANSGLISTNPEDFNLYCIGQFNTETGIISAFDTPELIVNCRDLKKVEVE